MTDRDNCQVQLHVPSAGERLRRVTTETDVPTTRVVHDFRNALSGIVGCAEHALASLPADSPARADLEQILRVASSAAAYGERTLSRARAAVVGRVRSFELDEAVQASEHVLRRLVGDGISFSLRLGGAGACIWGEAHQLERVLANLVINARNATPQGGSITIRTRLVSLPSLGRFVVLRVKDTGSGMDAATRARAFEPFFTSRGGHGGTGLGLVNVHAAVRQAGGRISVRSVQGVGTTFTICWPCVAPGIRDRRSTPDRRAPVEPTPVATLPHEAASVPTTVLLVEDEALIALAAEHHLAAAGYRVIVARNARQAQLQAVQHRGSIDVLLTDVVLPGRGSGIDVARAVTSLHPQVAVVYMSAHPLGWLRRKRLLGPDGVAVEKPFSRERLIARVEEALAAARRRVALLPPAPAVVAPRAAQLT